LNKSSHSNHNFVSIQKRSPLSAGKLREGALGTEMVHPVPIFILHHETRKATSPVNNFRIEVMSKERENK
jgi:hypothetical protein